MGSPAVQTFGKYQILERIATGGMAEIYKARLEGIGGFQRTFAIKRILPHLSQNADYVAMLVDEAKVAGLLSHANIVQILDLGQVDGVWYIAMEYVHGRDLGAVLKRCRERGLRLPVPHTVFLAIELLKGLEYAHQRQVMRGGRPVPLNIIHRDVSPPNILMAFQGEVKLTDFGIARASLKVMETQQGVIKGRFDYMSPEQAAGAKDLDQRSDLFSVGVVLYEMLTGAHPFRAESELTTLENVRVGKYEPISSRNPDVPFTLETIVDRALRVERDERYPSATAFKEALDKFFHDAGFIFTHSTLAAYVKGLFPEADHPGQSGSSEATPFRLGDEDAFPTDAVTEEVDFAGLEEGPTKLMDRKIIDDEIARQASKATPGSFGFAAEDETQIRRSPLRSAGSASDWGEDVATVVKRALPEPEPMLADTGDPPTVINQDASIDEMSTILRKRSELEDSTLRRASADQPSGGGGRMMLALTSVAAIMLFFGLFVGGVVGIAGTRLLLAPGTGPAAALSSAGTLKVVAPAGAVVKVNNVLFSGESVQISAGQPQKVEVVLEGHPPWTEEVSVAPGEFRVIVLTAGELKPSAPE